MLRVPACLVICCLLLSFAASSQRVVLDYYFNHEFKTTATGDKIRYHYLWNDKTNSGFSAWGSILRELGATLDTLAVAPMADNLKNASVYIIVDPDNRKEAEQPNYIELADINNIAAWVKNGGTLVLLANDSANVELAHLNNLAAMFGLHFGDDIQNHVVDDAHFNDGIATIANTSIFKTTKRPFIKDACSITFGNNATVALRSPAGAAIAVLAEYGKGKVFAVGDPWLYNEYLNGRLPEGFDNEKAATDLSNWLLHGNK